MISCMRTQSICQTVLGWHAQGLALLDDTPFSPLRSDRALEGIANGTISNVPFARMEIIDYYSIGCASECEPVLPEATRVRHLSVGSVRSKLDYATIGIILSFARIDALEITCCNDPDGWLNEVLGSLTAKCTKTLSITRYETEDWKSFFDSIQKAVTVERFELNTCGYGNIDAEQYVCAPPNAKHILIFERGLTDKAAERLKDNIYENGKEIQSLKIIT